MNWLIFFGVWTLTAVVVSPLIARAFFKTPSPQADVAPCSEVAPRAGSRDGAAVARGAFHVPALDAGEQPPE